MLRYLATSALMLVALMLAAGSVRADIEKGRQLVREHCTRCHVVADINPYGGISSTPSFGGMKSLDDWRERFESFYVLPPHPALVRVEGVSEDRPANLPAFSTEIVLSVEQVEAILAYVDTLEKK